MSWHKQQKKSNSDLRTIFNLVPNFVKEIIIKIGIFLSWQVARLQLQIFESLSRGREAQKPRVQEALARLNSELVDITTVSNACPHELTQAFKVESKLINVLKKIQQPPPPPPLCWNLAVNCRSCLCKKITVWKIQIWENRTDQSRRWQHLQFRLLWSALQDQPS